MSKSESARMRAAVGLNVKRLRKAADLTQQELSEAVRLSRAQVANIESGRSGIEMAKVMTFARALNCTADQLLATGHHVHTNGVIQ